ncbi:trna pseudouridine synthase a [Vairimorpha ceranae]|uniref:Trna pseudouridine synthase a n=1 Tax=Vairimorpha ceranae TaxID=40302 RepID=A0A0F9WEE6_9MICR|nr:trna pseudouridine synthase a [Vairimorpha ceranae]KAF5141758.1 hypothetical protein G9O61_00g000410 [Vairimorpha ceranae]KKO75761.1 trna pseudouridine synthase a [Vairimorpha ceranae]
MKIKAGFCIGYIGTGYSGLQLNGDYNTIEKAISECLFSCSAISSQNAKDPSKIHLKSSSRTDKGVHAAFNLISCKIECQITDVFFQKLKECLFSKNIYLYKILRLTKSFIPTNLTISRTYEYILPTYFLAKSNFSAECSDLIAKDLNRDKMTKREYNEKDIEQIFGYLADKDDIKYFCDIFTKFLGTKNFHNFTTLSNHKGKQRYIKNIEFSNAYVIDDIEYIKITIEGQSFLLHQIRKMIYFSVLLCRYKRNEFSTIFEKVFSDEYLHVPKGPSQYLLLDSPKFLPLKDKGKMNDTLEINLDEKNEYKVNVIYKCIHDKQNLKYFLACLDSSRFYNDELNYLF